jgi:hypothetical protein
VAILAVLLAGPQQAARLPGSRIDNLHRASAVLAAHELPGDAVLYIPASRRILSMAYPGPWRRLRDIALGRSPAAAATPCAGGRTGSRRCYDGADSGLGGYLIAGPKNPAVGITGARPGAS